MSNAAYKEIPIYKYGDIVSYSKVDTEDFETLIDYIWYPHYKGHAYTGRGVMMHRKIMGLVKGDGLQVDHINRDRLDNRKENLRIVNNAQNCQNRIYSHGISKYRGVTWKELNKKWQVSVKLNGKHHYLGLYRTAEEAGQVARDFRIKNMPFTTLEDLNG